MDGERWVPSVTGLAMYAACRIGDKRILLPLLEFLDAQGRHLWTVFAVSDDMQDYPGDEDRQWACSFNARFALTLSSRADASKPSSG